MGSTLTGRGRRYIGDAARAWERAPVEVSTALVLAAAWSYAVEAGGEAMRSWSELAIAGLLVMAAAWSATLLHGLGALDRRQRWTLTFAGAVAAALYGALVLDLERATEGWRALMLVAAALLWVVAVPWLPRRSIDEMRAVSGRFLLRVIGGALYCAALFAGLALAVAAVDSLFELNLDGKIFAHVFGWIALALGPWIVFGGLDEYVTPHVSAVAPVVHRMAAFLVPPLVAIYFLILYAYMVRMGVTGEVPKNLVSPLVFAAGVLVALALLLFDPRQQTTVSASLLRIAPPLFVPPTVLGVFAIILRVDQYGWTEFRLLRLLLLVAFGLLAAGATVQLVRQRRLALHLVPLSLAALLIVAAVGPWSVNAVSRRSQQARLEQALRQADVDPDVAHVETPPERTIDAGLYDDILNTGLYLSRHHGASALPTALAEAPLTPEPAPPVPVGPGQRPLPRPALPRERGDLHGAMLGLGLRPGQREAMEQEMRYGRLSHTGALEVEGVRVRRLYVAPYRGEATSGDATAVQDGDLIRIQADGRQLTADLSGLARSLRSPQEPGAGELMPDQARIDVRDGSGAVVGSLLVLEVNLESGPDGIRLHRLDGLLLLAGTR